MTTIEQRLAALEQENEVLTRRIDIIQNQNRNPHEISGELIKPEQSFRNPPIAYGSPQTYTATSSYRLGPPMREGPSSVFIVNPSGPAPPPPAPAESGWSGWTCCMLWFGLSHLLGGIGMVIPGALLLATANRCQYPYTLQYTSCCYQNVCKPAS
jgi:hypothetical protein